MTIERILGTDTGKQAFDKCNTNFDTNKTDILSLNTTVGSVAMTTTAQNVKGAINELDADIGNKTTLTTDVKTDLVNAINEHETQINNLDAEVIAHKAKSTYYIMLVIRDLTLIGIQTISDLPFRPKSIEIIASVEGTSKISNGMWCEQSKSGIASNQASRYQLSNSVFGFNNGYSVTFNEGAGSGTHGTIGNITDISFDIIWSKYGTGATGSCNLIIKMGGHY